MFKDLILFVLGILIIGEFARADDMVEEEVTDADVIESTIKIPTYVTEILVDSDKTTLAKKDVDEINYMGR